MSITQYKYYRIENPSDIELKQIGLDGWKLITVASRNDGHTVVYLFMREL